MHDGESVLITFFVFCVVLYCGVCHRSVSYGQFRLCLRIVHSWLSLRFSLTFVNYQITRFLLSFCPFSFGQTVYCLSFDLRLLISYHN